MNVTIVGAGLIGCALAYELSSRGVRVRVVDPRAIGHGATRASAGILAPHIEGHSAPLLRLLLCSLELYDGFLERLAADVGPIEYDRAGTLQTAIGPDERAALQRTAARLAAAGVPHQWLSSDDAVTLEPSLSKSVSGALRIPGDGYVAVGPLVAALCRAAAARGATFDQDRVVAVRASSAGAVVAATRQTYECDAAIVAAGSWSSEIANAAVRPAPVRPIRGQLLRLGAATRPAARVIWGRHCYLVPWRDGTVLAGATVEDVGFDEGATVAGVRHLLNCAVELMPGLEQASFEEVRVGLRPAAPDELPVIGPSSTLSHVFFATGHYRNGVLLAPLTAALVADLVVDGCEREELALTRPARVGL